MATNSQPQETPEYRTFRVHYDRLVHAIQDPLSLATRLFTQGIITYEVKDRVNILGLSKLEKTDKLLSAIEGQIRSDPNMFQNFLSALNKDPSMHLLVESMQSKCVSYVETPPPPPKKKKNVKYSKETRLAEVIIINYHSLFARI